MINRLIGFVVYSNLWVALAATFLAIESSILFGNEVDPFYALFVFSGTVTLYICHRWIGLSKANLEPIPRRLAYIRQHDKGMAMICGICIILAAVSLSHLPLIMISGYLFSALVLGILYIMPVFRHSRLRDFPFIKIFVIAITWTILTAIIPIRLAGLPLTGLYLFASLEKFLFIFLLTLPFDYRDAHVDKSVGLKTLANRLSINNLKLLTLGIGFLGAITSIKYSCELHQIILPGAFIFVYTISILLALRSYHKKSEMFYAGVVEGWILFRAIIIIIIITASNV